LVLLHGLCDDGKNTSSLEEHLRSHRWKSGLCKAPFPKRMSFIQRTKVTFVLFLDFNRMTTKQLQVLKGNNGHQLNTYAKDEVHWIFNVIECQVYLFKEK
jgi:hypothetical protein